MKILAVASLCATLALALPAGAQQQQQPTPPQPDTRPQGYYQPPGQQPNPDPYGQAQGYDPGQQPPEGEYDSGDSDPDIDGYDAATDVTYDNAAAQSYDDGYDPNAYSQFESALDAYGTWVDDPVYGRVWVPSTSVVGNDFFPYATGGYWVLSEFGWTWVSDWDWGWAPFHYGRWSTLDGYGWCWIPGSVWGPAWVSWRSGGGYVGWSPLPPAGVTIGPPTGVRSGWRFTLAGQLGTRGMTYLPAHVVPSVFARTSVVSNARTVTVGKATVRVNAGPTSLAVGRGVGVTTPVSLRTLAPRALPHPSVVTHHGVALASRPWVRAGVGRVGSISNVPRPISIPIGPQHSSSARPIYNAPVRADERAPARPYDATARPNMYVAPSRTTMPPRPYVRQQNDPVYRNSAPVYNNSNSAAPVYRSSESAPVYRPSYSQPVYRPSESTPVYRPSESAPSYQRSYSAPTYQPSYSQPSYRVAPANRVSAPSAGSSTRHSAAPVAAPAARGRRR
jgi:hypothetical protein